MLSWSMGLPNLFGKTSPFSSHKPTSMALSSRRLSRWRLRISSAAGVSTTLLRPLALLGSPKQPSLARDQGAPDGDLAGPDRLSLLSLYGVEAVRIVDVVACATNEPSTL